MSAKLPFFRITIGIILAAALLPAVPAKPAETSGIGLLDRMVRQIMSSADGTFGVAVEHIESGKGFLVNGDETFPMASVVKLPILTEVMSEIREGRFALSDFWEVKPSDQFYDGSLLSDLAAPGIRLSVENLINMMMWLSDNTATDLLLNKVGPSAVTARIRSFGIDKITVDRAIREILLDYYIGESAPYRNMGPGEFKAAYDRVAAEKPDVPRDSRLRFPHDPRDHATPRAMNALLGKLFRKQILDPESCDYVFKVMSGCQTGTKRIRGLLPPDTLVAHKTGTIGGTINDCGLIGLPGGRGHVALSILSRDADPDHAEDVIALIAKSVYDYFCFAAPEGQPRP
jgi:beta-lactamase class A